MSTIVLRCVNSEELQDDRKELNDYLKEHFRESWPIALIGWDEKPAFHYNYDGLYIPFKQRIVANVKEIITEEGEDILCNGFLTDFGNYLYRNRLLQPEIYIKPMTFKEENNKRYNAYIKGIQNSSVEHHAHAFFGFDFDRERFRL